MHWKILRLAAVLLAAAPVVRAVDQNNNQQSDVWEMLFQFSGLPAAGDFDGDGWSNAVESSAGTNPKDGASFPQTELHFAASLPQLSWQSLEGKRYALLASASSLSDLKYSWRRCQLMDAWSLTDTTCRGKVSTALAKIQTAA